MNQNKDEKFYLNHLPVEVKAIYQACCAQSKKVYGKRYYPFTKTLGIMGEYKHNGITINEYGSVWGDAKSDKKTLIRKRAKKKQIAISQHDIDTNDNVRKLVREAFEQLKVDSQKAVRAHKQQTYYASTSRERLLDSIGRDL